jgi:hypothetical protein
MPNVSKPRIFIGSSSESVEAVKAVRRLLKSELGDAAQLAPWPREFALSATYIESLEKAAKKADFGIFVLGRDDVTFSRKRKTVSPRDNVVFELGLFMGRLGRSRCFALVEGSDLRVPSDLLGVATAKFQCLGEDALEDTLDDPCLEISEEVRKQGKHPLTDQDMQIHAANRSFCRALEGSWWERHDNKDAEVNRPGVGVSLNFFRIEIDNMHNSVCLKNGRSFNSEGNTVATWKSLTARAADEENKLHYVWRGWSTGKATISFHGYGEMEFDRPNGSGSSDRGWGRFWDVDESNPQRTNRKSFELRRLLNEREITLLSKGTERHVKSLVKRTLAEW